MVKKPYTWEEIKEFLIKELNKTKHILTWGAIGSCNIEHDIDTIITKKPSSKTSDFYKEIQKIFDKLRIYLRKNYNSNVVLFSRLFQEHMLFYLGRLEKNDLVFQLMVYTSYPQMEVDWRGAQDVNLRKLINDSSFLLGRTDSIFSKTFKKKNHYDPTYLFSYHDFVIFNSNFPEKFILRYSNKVYDYLFRKRLGLKTPFIVKNKDQAKEIFYKLCDKLDELEAKRK